MAQTSATILEARRAVLTVATALVASTIASAAVIIGMMAVIGGAADASKSYWTAVTLKESGKQVPIKRVVRARPDELASTHLATVPARAQIPSEFYAVTCGVEKVPPTGPVCPADWRRFLVGLPVFELDLSSTGGARSINQQLGG